MVTGVYAEFAAGAPMPSTLTVWFYAILIGSVPWIAFDFLLDPVAATSLGVASIVVAFVLLRRRYSSREADWLAGNEADYPGFSEFFGLWKQQRDLNDRMALEAAFQAGVGTALVSAAAVAVVGVATASAAAHENAASERRTSEWKMRNDVRRIADAVERM